MRLGFIGLVAVSALSLSACGSKSDTDKVALKATTTTTTATSSDNTVAVTTTLEPATSTTRVARATATSTTAALKTAQPNATTTTVAGTVVSSTNNASYGEILVDASGRTLYLFTPDDGTSSPQCTGSCAQTWPPLKATGTPRATGGAHQSMLGVESGQVTYNGHPLYLYAGDSAPGQTNGQGVGAIWYVVSTSGNAVLR